jgi:hypothetical protein
VATSNVEQIMMGIVKAESTLPIGFNRATGMHYYTFLRHAHAKIKPKWYLEIGTCKGKSLASVKCASVAIDPVFQLQVPVHVDKPLLLLLQAASDDAFASEIFTGLDAKFDIAFLDGMHRFEYLLRDIINAERNMARNGTIFLHDTAPFNFEMTARTQIPGPWTGDVWKLLPILAEYRPDLIVDHLDCRPTGVAMIRGDWGINKSLEINYEAIVSRYMSVTLEQFGAKRYYKEHSMFSSVEKIKKL